MTKQARLQTYLKQWETAAELLQAPFTPAAYEKMSAYLLGRDALEDALGESPQLAARLRTLDLRFVRALADSRLPWPREITDAMDRMDLADSSWWQGLLQKAANRLAKRARELEKRAADLQPTPPGPKLLLRHSR